MDAAFGVALTAALRRVFYAFFHDTRGARRWTCPAAKGRGHGALWPDSAGLEAAPRRRESGGYRGRSTSMTPCGPWRCRVNLFRTSRPTNGVPPRLTARMTSR